MQEFWRYPGLLFDRAQQGLFEAVVQPVLYGLDMGGLAEDGFAATGWLLVGLLQLLVLVTLIAALQRWRPVEAVTDRRAVRVDIAYTLIHRLGLVRLLMFFSIDPLWDSLIGELRVAGLPSWHLDALWPGVTDQALVSFVLYLLLFDFVNYWLHRGQHQFHWWWQLHALHHSQRQMTMWSDDRNHLIDDLLLDSVFVAVALLVGVGPGQFVALVALTQLLESLSHANLRMSFGRIGRRLLVSPQFHRHHHAIGSGHESAGAGTLGGHNFAVLFPVWDLLFGTAYWGHDYPATGVRDQLEGRRYGQGFWSQQGLGLLRLLGKA